VLIQVQNDQALRSKYYNAHFKDLFQTAYESIPSTNPIKKRLAEHRRAIEGK
jgi:hypothetical protein